MPARSRLPLRVQDMTYDECCFRANATPRRCAQPCPGPRPTDSGNPRAQDRHA